MGSAGSTNGPECSGRTPVIFPQISQRMVVVSDSDNGTRLAAARIRRAAVPLLVVSPVRPRRVGYWF